MNAKSLILSGLILAWSVSGQAQSGTKNLSATATYVAAYSESTEQAEQKAVNMARMKALRDEFGTLVSSATVSSTVQRGDLESTKLVSLDSEGEPAGEWIADTERPNIRKELTANGLTVTASVKGVGAKITSDRIETKARVLRNMPRPEFESSEFVAGDSVYAMFRSSVDGYLAIYLVDENEALCLLPYANNAEGLFHINHGQDYTLFSYKHYSEDENPNDIYEYTLTSDEGQTAVNHVYFIFSPNKFRKALDGRKRGSDEYTIYPPVLSWEDFQRWLIRMRRADKDMTVTQTTITIKPRW